MTFLGVELHPLAEAVLRHVMAESATEEPNDALAQLFVMVDRLPPERVAELGADLLVVCRFLDAQGRYAEAIDLAHRLDASAQRATQRSGATALLDVETRDSGEQFSRTLGWRAPVKLTPVEAAEHLRSAPMKTRLQDKWSSLSESKRQRLAGLASELSSRLQ